MKKYKNSNGFTLVELIIVLVILAILAAFTIPAMLGFVGNSKEKLCESARNDCLRYYQTQATEKLPTTREEAIPILAKAIQNSYGDATVENNVAKGVCPAGGEYKLEECKFELENGYYRLKEVPCSIHHDKDSSRPNLTAAKNLIKEILSGEYFKNGTAQAKFIKDFWDENGGKLNAVDEEDLVNVFGKDWKNAIQGSPSELYWRPLIMKVNGQETYVMYANARNTSDQGQWKGFMVEVNGQYYRAEEKNGKVTENQVNYSFADGGLDFQDSAALELWLLGRGFTKVE